jgi:hypothetical protein
MVAAYQLVAFDFAFAQQGALVGASALEGPPADACPHERDINAACRHRERTVANEIS